jgi:hypothetical protein
MSNVRAPQLPEIRPDGDFGDLTCHRFGRNADQTNLPHLPLRSPPSLTMVRSTIIARQSDALPLAASVDDEQVQWLHVVPDRSTDVFDHCVRQRMSCRSTSSRPNSSSDGLRPTQNHVVR